MTALQPLVIVGTGFLTAGVKIGDTVATISVTNTAYTTTNSGNPLVSGKLLSVGATPNAAVFAYDSILVSEVTSETSLKAIPYVNGVAITDSSQSPQYNLALATGDTFTYQVIHYLTKDEQVTSIAATASSYASKRVLYIWPPEAYWDSALTETVNGSALAACTAAAMATYPAQQSFTNLGFGGPYKLLYSNTYFTPTQLNKLSENGVFVLVQDTPGGNIYSRHQKTTSTVSIQEQEFSITKAVDKLSLDLYSSTKPYIGKYNINQDLLTQIASVLDLYMYSAQSNKSAYCGALIISYATPTLRANLDGANTDLTVGTIEISVTVEIGYPANFINILLYVN
jgi:hypothetical protein